ncbi:MAG: ComF family protein [Firmicutes bacterium]|nr:ComF family protein [Bacillota bacterium]
MVDTARIRRIALDILFGAEGSCPVCGRSGRSQSLCSECMALIPMTRPPTCSVCGTPLRAGATSDNDARREMCTGCLGIRHYFECARAPAIYEGAARQHVHDLKYRARVEIVPALSALMAHCAINTGMADSCDCATPVPLHPDRLIRRGFNQAGLLARSVSSLLGITLIPGALARHASTGTQTFLDRRHRRDNVIRAFVCDEPARMAGRTIMLIDDVLTSGATADGCARALLRSGASKVYVLTFAVSVADARDWAPRRGGALRA